MQPQDSGVLWIRTGPLALWLVVVVLLGGCSKNGGEAAPKYRAEQTFTFELLDAADIIVAGNVDSIVPKGAEYLELDPLGRKVRVRQVELSVTVLGVLKNKLEDELAESLTHLTFLFVERLGLVGGEILVGPPQDFGVGVAVIPLRLENGRWRSVVDSWRPLLPIDVPMAVLAPLMGQRKEPVNLTEVLLQASAASGNWPVMEASADALAYLYGTPAVIRDLRRVAFGKDAHACSVCLHLAKNFPGQYGCLRTLLENDRCEKSVREGALMVRNREPFEVKNALRAIQVRNDKYLATAVRVRSMSEMFTVYSMHSNEKVRDAVGAWRKEVERP